MELGSITNLSLYRRAQLASAKAKWRETATIVSMRWDAFLQAEAQAREFSLKSYFAALDAEETAAAELERLASGTARYRSAA